MRKQNKPARDPDNPPWTKAMFSRAQPAREMEPDLVANPPRIGRPPVEKPKQQISLRLDPDVIAAYRSTGAGWQKLMQKALAKAAPKSTPAAIRRTARKPKKHGLVGLWDGPSEVSSLDPDSIYDDV